jgi:geranylgeranyl diphosphate synthase type II
MHKIEDLYTIIKYNIEKLDFKLEPAELYDPISYTLSFGGKRIRPVLTLLACDMYGGNIEDALDAAISLEMFHNFTLIHDDIMDKAPLRRGKATVYKKWNTDIAILSGDTLFAKAYQVAINTNERYLKKVLVVLTKVAIDVCEGQQYDMNFETDKNVTIPKYIEMIRLKTAALIGSCLKAGAIIGNASEEEAENIYKFGENLGIAFQLKDDLLDVYGDEVVFGKKEGGDIVSNKKTYLSIKAFELAEGDDAKTLSYFFSGKDFSESEKINNIKNIYNKLLVKDLAEKEMTYYYQCSLNYLDKINLDSDKKQELKKLAEKLIIREF